MGHIVTIFFSSLCLSLVLTPIVKKAMLRLGVLNMPSESRWHQRPVALLGGIAIFVSFALVVLLRVKLEFEIIVILLGGAVMFVLGLSDDHLAAAVGVKYIMENPLKAIQINIHGTGTG